MIMEKKGTNKAQNVYPSDRQTLLQRLHQYQLPYACVYAELQESFISHPDLMIQMLSGNWKNTFFQISAVLMGICAYMDIEIMKGQVANIICLP